MTSTPDIEPDVAEARRELGAQHRNGMAEALRKLKGEEPPLEGGAQVVFKNGNGYNLPSPFVVDLDKVLFDIRAMLLEKNASYGNSALDPIRCFSRADAVEQIKVRIDDKISRLMRGNMIGKDATAVAAEDVTLDLIGYLILLRIAQKKG
jgi:hypothetical protein